MIRRTPVASAQAMTILLMASMLGVFGHAGASLIKPSYAAGDHWVYALEGSFAALPGFNASEVGSYRFGLLGRVEVDVIGPANVSTPNGSVPSIQVETRTFGYLNGSFSIPGSPGTISVTGTFSSSTEEFWEDGAYLPIESRTMSSYMADITYIITTHLDAEIRLNATATIASIPRFDLDVGENASSTLDTRLVTNSTVTLAGRTSQMNNQTEAASTWQREVLARENVTVVAGTFLAYKMNQTLAGFAGIPGAFEGGNETAYFSNDVGYYVKRDAYANGTRVAGMSLTSYSYGPQPSGWSVVDWFLFVAAPIALAFVVGLLIWRRRKSRKKESPSPVGPDAPLAGPGGGSGAR